MFTYSHNRCSTIATILLFTMGCGNEVAAPSPDATAPNLSATSTNKGLSICSWGLGDYATGDSYLASFMNQDGTYQIGQYINFPGIDGNPNPPPQFFIDSKPTAGLTTVYKDSLVIIKGNLPASSYSSDPLPGNPPPAETTAVVLALDLRLVVTPKRGTGLHPSGQGSLALTRFMLLTGTINGVQIGSGSQIADKLSVGKPFAGVKNGPATPFNFWNGVNGSVQFCTH